MSTSSIEQSAEAKLQSSIDQVGDAPVPAAPVTRTENDSIMSLGTFDSLLKYLAAFSVLLYCCGYFVCSVSSLSWGFYQVAPFRPKIASAGAWFILFLGVPLAALAFQKKEKPTGWVTGAASFQFYAIWGIGLGYGTASLFESTIQIGPHAFFSPLVVVVGYSVILVIRTEKKTATTISWAIAMLSVSYVAGCGFYDLSRYHLVTASAVFLWYLIVGFAFSFMLRQFRDRSVLEHLTRSVPFIVSQSLAALSVFGSVYYPHIKATWGGGAPVPVTILFTKESQILPGQYLSIRLLDESESGLYIAGKGEKSASFIPRSEIASITYSDLPSAELQAKPK